MLPTKRWFAGSTWNFANYYLEAGPVFAPRGPADLLLARAKFHGRWPKDRGEGPEVWFRSQRGVVDLAD